MGLTDVSGVFSRYFVVGFFLPAFLALVTLSQIVHDSWLPAIYNEASRGAQVAILGGAAVPIGLTLSGLNYHILRLYEGYPLAYQSHRPILKSVYEGLIGIQRGRFSRAMTACTAGTPQENRVAEWRLDQRFPRRALGSDDTSLLLPSSFGNTLRAFERHSFLRWGLDSIAVWDHIALLLSDQEQQALDDARGNVAFFINLSLLSTIGLVALATNQVLYEDASNGWLLVIPAAVAFLAYRAGIASAGNWGGVVRAAIDLHHREIYEKLGLRAPQNFSDEKRLAWRLNQTLLTGAKLDDDDAATSSSPSLQAPTDSSCTNNE